MESDDFDITGFMKGFGFTEDDVNAIEYELEAYRSIPGTTVRRYLNRVLATIGDGERTAFLKGIYMGVAIRSAADVASAEEPSVDIDIAKEERWISEELERLGRTSRN